MSVTGVRGSGSAKSNTRPARRLLLARAGEQAAADFYAGQGGQILARNWRAGRYGEIDLIIKERSGTIVFAEVKSRRVSSVGGDEAISGIESVHRRKQQKIVTSAGLYLARHGLIAFACRFDVVLVEYEVAAGASDRQELPRPNITQIASAFAP